MGTRLYLVLDTAERNGLNRLAERELRDPREQLRVILRAELERNGMWSVVSNSNNESRKQTYLTKNE